MTLRAFRDDHGGSVEAAVLAAAARLDGRDGPAASAVEAEPPPPLCDGPGDGKVEDPGERTSHKGSPRHPEREGDDEAVPPAAAGCGPARMTRAQAARLAAASAGGADHGKVPTAMATPATAVRAGGRRQRKQGTVVAGPAAAEATASATPGGCRLPRFGEVLHSANGSPLGTFAARGGITPLCRGDSRAMPGVTATVRQTRSRAAAEAAAAVKPDAELGCGSLAGMAVELDCDGNVITLSCPEDGQQLPERLRGLAVDRLRSLQSHLSLLMANMEVAKPGISAGAVGCVKVEPP
eukprot:SM000022S07227  [mRNA]  locus=s22:631612:633466:- [translate_table: standard]